MKKVRQAIKRRPALRYHGGKWMLAPWIIGHFPEHRIYVEPFGGGASVLMRKQPCYSEVYNDLDSEVVNFFRVLRDTAQAAELCRLIYLTPFSRIEFYQAYEGNEDPIEQARRTLLRSLAGFGSDGITGNVWTGFRANANRSGTTPAHDWSNYPAAIQFFTERLRTVVIECRPALEIVSQQDSPATLFYVDPPYVHETRSSSKRYRHEMDEQAHRELAAGLRQVEGMVVLSGYHSELYDELYSDWDKEEREVLADGARPRTEALWLNPAAQKGLERKGLFAEQVR